MTEQQPDDLVTKLAEVIGGAMILRTSTEEIARAVLRSGLVGPAAYVTRFARSEVAAQRERDDLKQAVLALVEQWQREAPAYDEDAARGSRALPHHLKEQRRRYNLLAGADELRALVVGGES